MSLAGTVSLLGSALLVATRAALRGRCAASTPFGRSVSRSLNSTAGQSRVRCNRANESFNAQREAAQLKVTPTQAATTLHGGLPQRQPRPRARPALSSQPPLTASLSTASSPLPHGDTSAAADTSSPAAAPSTARQRCDPYEQNGLPLPESTVQRLIATLQPGWYAHQLTHSRGWPLDRPHIRSTTASDPTCHYLTVVSALLRSVTVACGTVMA